jgi:hypothetical protein
MGTSPISSAAKVQNVPNILSSDMRLAEVLLDSIERGLSGDAARYERGAKRGLLSSHHESRPDLKRRKSVRKPDASRGGNGQVL